MPRTLLLVLTACFIIPFIEAQPSTPLVGPLVAFVPAEQDRVILYDLGGATQRELQLGEGWLNVWDFSPDGCRILYTLTQPDGLGRAYTADLTGADPRPLVRYDALPDRQWGVWEPQWSPDGSRIAFTLLRDGFQGKSDRQYHIGWVSPEGGAPTFYSVTGREHTARWSADGEWLAYVSYDERVAGANPFSTAEPTSEPAAGQPTAAPVLLREADLWVVRADASAKFRLTAFAVGSVSMPRWSPDSERLGFVYSPSPSNDTIWIVARQPNATPTQLTTQWSLLLDLNWLPDGSALLAAARDLRGVRENRLWQIPLISGADENASQFIAADLIAHTDYPRFSADGRYLALRNTYAPTVYDLTQGALVLLDDARPGNTAPVWSPGAFTGEAACAL